MKKGKVQTNRYNINVLVEYEDCNSKHYHYPDFGVLCQPMTIDEINKEYGKRVQPPTLDDKIRFLQKIEGFAISNVYSEENNIQYDQLFKYEKL